MKTLLVSAILENSLRDPDKLRLFRQNTPRLKEYCERWGYIPHIFERESAPHGQARHDGNPCWIKFGFYKEIYPSLDPGDAIIWIDCDTIQIRKDIDLTTKKDFSIGREPTEGMPLNAGIMSWKKCDFADGLIDAVWNMKEEQLLPGYPLGWCDQSAIFTFLSSLTDEEKEKHVEIWPTHVNGCGSCERMDREVYRNMVIRHFAGNRTIEWGFFNHPLREGPLELRPL